MKFLRLLPFWATKFSVKEVININKFIRILILAAVLSTFGFGLITPIFAVFLTKQIAGGTLMMVGLAEMIYLGTKSLFQIPISILIDKTPGERIDFYCMFVGGLLIAMVPFSYLFASLPWQVYLLQFIHGLGAALDWPAWMGLFTRHIDENKESFEWSLQTTMSEFGLAGAALVGGSLANYWGFKPLFLLIGFFSLLTVLVLVVFYQKIKEETPLVQK